MVSNMNWIDKLLGTNKETSTKSVQTRSELEKVQKTLTSIDQEKAPYIACIALLAARLAGADMDISPGEKQRIAEILQQQIHISPEEARAAAEIATEQELANSIEHHKITELINDLANSEQKLELIRALFYVACDEDISEVESEKIRSISKALRISNDQYISIRSDFSKHRSILK